MQGLSLATRDAFTQDATVAAYDCIQALVNEGKDVSMMTFAQKWRATQPVQMPASIIGSIDVVSSPSQLSYFVEGIKEAFQRRKILQAGNLLTGMARNRDKDAKAVLSEAEAILSESDIQPCSMITGKDAALLACRDMENRVELQGRLSGVPSGFGKLDALTNGIQYGENFIIGARPSIGKTALGLNLLHHACFVCGIPSLFISLEMSVESLIRRLAGYALSLDLGLIKAGALHERDMFTYGQWVAALQKHPIYFIDGTRGMDGNQIASAITRHAKRYGVRFAVLDYMQKAKAIKGSKNEKRTYDIEENSTTIRSSAVRNKVALVTLAQVSRESEKEKDRAPRLSDLADSKSIEQDGDTIGLLHRKRGEKETMLIIAKQRDGEIGPVSLEFDGRYGRFYEPHYAPIEAADYPT